MPERLTECLIRRRLLDPARAREAIERQVLLGGALDTCLLELNMVSETALVDAISAAYGLPTATTRQVTAPVDERVCRTFPEPWAKKHGLAPLSYEPETRILTVLSPAPPDMLLLSRLGDLLEVTVAPLLVPEYRVHQRLSLLYGDPPEERFRALMELRPDSPVASTSSPGLESPLVSAGVARLREAQDRDEIIQIALEYAHAELELVAMFIVQERRLEGFAAMGVGAENVGSTWLPLTVDSAFRRVLHTQTHHFGPLPDDAVHGDLLARLSRNAPRSALILPVKIRTRTVALLYGDNGSRPISPRLAADLITLSTHIQEALERLLVRRKSSGTSSEIRDLPPTSTQDLHVMLSENAPGRPPPGREAFEAAPTMASAPALETDSSASMVVDSSTSTPVDARSSAVDASSSRAETEAAFDEAIAAQSREPILGTEDPETLEALAVEAERAERSSSEGAARGWSEEEQRLARPDQETADADAIVDAFVTTGSYPVADGRGFEAPPRPSRNLEELREQANREAYASREPTQSPLARIETRVVAADSPSPSAPVPAAAKDPYVYDPFPPAPPTIPSAIASPLIAPDLVAPPIQTETYEPYVPPPPPEPRSGSGEWRAVVFEHHGPSSPTATPAPAWRPTEPETPAAASDEDEWASVAESLAGTETPPARSSSDLTRATVESPSASENLEESDAEASFARVLDTGSLSAPARDEQDEPPADREGFIDAAPAIESEASVEATQPADRHASSGEEPDTRYEPQHEQHVPAGNESADGVETSASSPEETRAEAPADETASTEADEGWVSVEVTSWEQWANGPGPHAEGASHAEPEAEAMPPRPSGLADVEIATTQEGESDGGWRPVSSDLLEPPLTHAVDVAQAVEIAQPSPPAEEPVPLTRFSSKMTTGEPVPLTRPSSRVSSPPESASQPREPSRTLRAESTLVDDAFAEHMRSISAQYAPAAQGTESASSPPAPGSGVFLEDPNMVPDESGSLPPPGSEDLFTDSDRDLPAGASEDLLAESPAAYAPATPRSAPLPPGMFAPPLPPYAPGPPSTYASGVFASTPFAPSASSPGFVSAGSTPGFVSAGSSPGFAISASSPGFVPGLPTVMGTPEPGAGQNLPAFAAGADALLATAPTRPRLVEGHRPEVPPFVPPFGPPPPAATVPSAPLPRPPETTNDLDRAAQFEFEARGLLSALESFDKVARRRARETLINFGPETLPLVMERYPGALNLDPFSARTQVLPPIMECGDLLAVIAAFGIDAHPYVVRKLDGPDPLQRLFATHFYGSVFAPEVIPRLVQRLHDEEPRISMLAARTLFGYRDVQEFNVVLDHLHGRLKATSLTARKHAAQLLGVFHDVTAVPFLIDVLERKERTLFEVVEAALEEITKQRFGSNPKKWRAWWVKNEGRPRMAWLIDGLSAKEVELRRSCAEELRALTGIDLGYDEEAPRKVREDARLRWVRWWNEQHRLHKGRPNGNPARSS